MPDTAGAPPRRDRPRPPPFRPRFTIGLFYFAAFFVLFEFLQVLPSLIDVLDSMEPGPAMQAEAERILRDESNLGLTFVLALAATALGSWYGVLPGTKA